MSRRIIEGNYARLCGLRDTLVFHRNIFSDDHYSNDYIDILKNLRENVADEFAGLDVPNTAFRTVGEGRIPQVKNDAVVSKIRQLIAYLEAVHSASSRIIEVGSVFNLIQDQEWKSRCADLLSAPGHFDRVINQATQVLEDRVRRKLPEFANDFGLPLFSKAINGEISKSRIVFSNNPSEQDGFAAIFRGLIGAFRNPSHHRFLENVSREQALQICAFIDNMLAALETAEVVNP